MESIDILLPAVAASYLLGSIPFGLLIARAISGVDPRQHGSGNIGATNAMRSGGKLVGILTLIADIAKAALPVALALYLNVREPLVAIVGFAAFIGHCFPVWLKFKGGKGVATMFGVMLPWIPWVAVAAFVSWFLVLKASGYVSLASVLAALGLPLLAWALGASSAAIIVCALIGLIVTVRHQTNLQRIYRGEEPKTSKK